MIQVINGVIKQYRLPKTGMLSDGTTVSGYNMLPKATLKSEGWLDLIDEVPEHNPETHYPRVIKYNILEDKVVKEYSIEELPELTEDKIRTEITEIQELLDVLTGGDPIV